MKIYRVDFDVWYTAAKKGQRDEAEDTETLYVSAGNFEDALAKAKKHMKKSREVVAFEITGGENQLDVQVL